MHQASSGRAAFLEGGGRCGDLIAKRDWSTTPLGPIAGWPASLTATVANMLHTRQPMLLFWGPELIQFYNDSFVPSFGQGKHPAAMGQRARDCWADAWPVVGAQIDAVMSRGEPAWYEDARIPIHRNGRMEEVFWTYSYSPAFDDRGVVHGTLVIVTETTGRVLAARRLEALAFLSLALSTATMYEAVFAALGELATRWPADLPVMVTCERGGPAHAMRHSAIATEQADAIARAAIASQPQQAPGELALDAGVVGPVWPEPIHTAVVSTMGTNDHVLVVGTSPRLPLDEGYRSYVAQIVEQVGSALLRIDNIAAQVRARQTLEKINEERGRVLLALENANRTKDEFLAMLGHELRNPLAPIVTALELMNAKDTSAERSAERVVIERQVKHVVRLVDDLLDVSKITRGVLSLDKRRVEIAEVITAAVETSAHLVEQRRHALVIEVPRNVFVDGDESRLVQVVSNLLTNAARYTPDGGELQVAVTASEAEVVIEVSDNGSGIEPELLPHIFESFVQGTRSADRAEGGLGLGLAIVKNLVSLHGGQVSVRSAGKDRGSSFVVRLPRAAAGTLEIAAPAQATPPTTVRRRVLVVDDNVDAADLLGEIVRMRGHDVTIVHDPESALAVVGELRPEIALLDIGLPGMDGYQLAQRMHACVPECRLIALTGYGQDSDRERSATAGFSAHLVKPVRIEMLLELLARGA